jgi:hypothetical protein
MDAGVDLTDDGEVDKVRQDNRGDKESSHAQDRKC